MIGLDAKIRVRYLTQDDAAQSAKSREVSERLGFRLMTFIPTVPDSGLAQVRKRPPNEIRDGASAMRFAPPCPKPQTRCWFLTNPARSRSCLHSLCLTHGRYGRRRPACPACFLRPPPRWQYPDPLRCDPRPGEPDPARIPCAALRASPAHAPWLL